MDAYGSHTLSGTEGRDTVSPKEKKGNGLWKRVKYQLIEYHSLPGYLRDNEFILGHYRSEWPLKQVFISIFTIHNETLNVWTHLIGFFLFLFLTIYTAMRVPHVDFHSLQYLHRIHSELSNCLPSLPNLPDLRKIRHDLITPSLPSMDMFSSLSRWHVLELIKNCLPDQFTHYNQSDHFVQANVATTPLLLILHPITRWPFFAFLGGAMFCLLSSSACHLLSCHSRRFSYILLRLDYAGIAALISTSFYPPVYYSFMCRPVFLALYLSTITLFGIATVIFSLLSAFESPEFRSLRAALFFGMGVSGVAPILHKLALHGGEPEAIATTALEVAMGVFYGAGAVIYATRVPERWRPGRFDLAGHSHQVFHVLVVAGAYTHYRAGLVYLEWRDLKRC